MSNDTKTQVIDVPRSASLDGSSLHGDAEKGRDYLKEKKEATEVVITPPEQLGDDDFPDGGLEAWLVVLGGFCTTFSTFGYVNTWGTFQAYYETVFLPTTSPSTMYAIHSLFPDLEYSSSLLHSAWIGSVQYALTFTPAIFIGRMFDLGYFKIPLLCASALLIVATFLVAECTKYWQFLLCQGFAIGLASGFLFGPSTAILSHWFEKRRGMALGIMACGSSLGGTMFPIAFHQLQIHVGFKWTMRIIGFILLIFTAIANLTLKRRLPPKHVQGGLFNFKVFKSAAFTVYTAAGFVAFLGLYTVLTYIDASAPSQGVDENLTFYLVSVANAASGFGRLASGFAADRFGAMNIMAPMTGLVGIMTYIWPFVHGQGPVAAVAVIYGLTSGAFVSLLATPMIAFGEASDVGRRAGMFMTTLSIGALAGPPISGAINTATGEYKAVGIYAGSCLIR
ncbi:hypothetical protein EWM64_g7608 [Hericium alpestre]|uniref:Major facilitator superfamily (MFS) profile domain-containing protein n=1 Tax=Hericium alpestre TaxID=135208 RepID=A0A4Y9ZNG2_9AGAM|nr:hypothetical protein EWM64_g7608 [Hericium alpestre]